MEKRITAGERLERARRAHAGTVPGEPAEAPWVWRITGRSYERAKLHVLQQAGLLPDPFEHWTGVVTQEGVSI